MCWRQMLDYDKRDAAVDGHSLQKAANGVKSAGGCTKANNTFW